MKLGEIGDPTYIALETFRKNGEGVVTPVWVVREGDKWYVWTASDSWKVKRIRNNSRVRVAISDVRGNPKSEWAEARAGILDAPEEDERQRARLAAKYGFQFKLWKAMARLRGGVSEHTVLELSSVQEPNEAVNG